MSQNHTASRFADNNSDKKIISTVKSYVVQPLIAILGMMIWHDITEMRSDIKALIPKVAANEVRIQKLEDDVKGLQSQKESSTGSPKKQPAPLLASNILFTMRKEDEDELVEKFPHE